MGRTKRIVDLVIRVVFIVLCFVATYLFNAYSEADFGGKISFVEGAEIDVFTHNGAEASYTVEDGVLVLDIKKAGEKHSDISLVLEISDIRFDTSYYEELLGKRGEEYAEYIQALKDGPWDGSLHYQVTGESLLSTGDKYYTIFDMISTQENKVASSQANTKEVSETTWFESGESCIIMLDMGTESTGPLPAGKYYIHVDLVLTGPSDVASPAGAKLNIFAEFTRDAMAQTSVSSMFRIDSLMTFYGMMVAFGCVFFMYQDLRACFKIAIAAFRAGGPPISIISRTYVNGVCVGYTYVHDEGAFFVKLLIAMITFMFVYMFFLLTIPIRMIIIICKDIFHIASGDANEEGFPIFGNLIGTVGVYGLLFAWMGFMASWNMALVIISLIIAIPALVFASKLCKKGEESEAY